MTPGFVYALCDPRTGEVRYVGQSVRPQERFINHLCEARRGTDYHSYRWIRELLNLGLRPQLRILEETTADLLDGAEQRWIAHCRAAGAALTNHTDGGGGMRGHKQSPQHVQKIAAANRGKKRSPETIARFKEVQNDPALKALLSEKRKGNKSRTGQQQSEEEKRKRADANRGKKRSPEFCETMRQKAIGVKHSEEAKKKMSAAKRGLLQTENQKAAAIAGRMLKVDAARRQEIARAAALARWGK